MENFSVSGNIVDVIHKRIFHGEVTVKNGIIKSIKEKETPSDIFIMPGFIDAHVHIESSMLIPSEFARLAVVHGTVATISDPHEIGNVLGIEGVKYMIDNGKKVPFKFYFGAPSCVPATVFETAGAEIGVEDVDELMQMEEVRYLAEMMNFPGVLSGDETVMQKIKIAQKYGKVIDGHAPGLRGENAGKYIEAGISTDHECFTKEEALDKLKHGMKIIIREGSAAKNFNALISLLDEYPDHIMFCSDDKHPNELVLGHIDKLAARAVAFGCDTMNVLRAVCYNPVKHYGMNVGLLQHGDPADFITVNNLRDFKVQTTYIQGKKVAENNKTLILSVKEREINQFNCDTVKTSDLEVKADAGLIRVIEATDGQLITNELKVSPKIMDGKLVGDADKDILKIVVINRYKNAPPAIAFIKNIGLKRGAIASSVAHDSHNIVAVGADDESIAKAVNLLIKCRGGVSLVNQDDKLVVPLPVAGLMSAEDGYKVAEAYNRIDQKAKGLGSSLSAPYMTLSFMALLVIPKLKLSDKGLFDGEQFEFTSMFC